MDSLVGLVVILYLVASVVGAVVERMRRGPLAEEPSVPSPRRRPVPAARPEKVMEAEDADEAGGFPAHLPESSQREPDTGEPAELQPAVFLEAGDELREAPWDSELAFSQEGALVGDIAASPIKHPHRLQREWHRAVVMMEIINQPRALNPYRPPWAR